MKPYTDINEGLLTLLILYLKNQEELYADYHDGFITLAQWLYTDDVAEVYSFPSGLAPWICTRCLHEDTVSVVGGSLRDGCHKCKGQLPYKEQALRLIWEFRFCEILRVNQEYFNYHLAHALHCLKEAKEMRS